MILPLKDWKATGIEISDDSGEDPIARALKSRERIVLDVHIGDDFERNRRSVGIGEEGLTMKPGECLRLSVREQIATPRTVFGLVCSRSSLAADGLVVSNIKIDPNFSGRLKVAVYNGGLEPIRLKKHESFASIWFAKLPEALDDAPNRTPTPTKALEERSLRVRLRPAVPYLATGTVTLAVGYLLKLVT